MTFDNTRDSGLMMNNREALQRREAADAYFTAFVRSGAHTHRLFHQAQAYGNYQVALGRGYYSPFGFDR